MASAAAISLAQQAYLAYYGRPADPLGQTYWAGQIDAHGLSSIINAFGTSAEATTLYGSLDTVHAINAIYNQQFGHDADPAGLNFYFQGIQNGTFTLASIALNVYNGATGTDATVVANRLAVANTFTAHLDLTTEILNYSGTAAANAARTFLSTVTSDPATVTSATANVDTTIANLPSSPGTTFTLTTGSDLQTANTFYGVLQATVPATNGVTLQSFDSLTGAVGGTNNSLIITDTTAINGGVDDVLPVGLTMSGVQKVTLTTSNNAGGAAANPFDTSGFAGVTAVTVTSAGADKDAVKAAATTNVTITSNAATDVITKGGNNVAITQNAAAGKVDVGGALATNPAGTVTVTANGVAGGVTAAVDGGTTVTITAGTGGTGSITVGAANVPTGAVTVSDTGGTGTISIQGGTSATVTSTATAANVVQVSGVTGATTVTVSAVSNGNSYVTGGTGATFTTTGGGNVTLGGTAAATNIAPIAGNATITDTNSSSLAANTDVLSVYATGTVNVTTSASSGNIVVGDPTPTKANSPTGAVTIVNQTVAGSSTYYGTSTTTVNTNGAPSVSITGGGGTTIADNTSVNALTSLTLTGVNGAVGITDTALTSVTINSNTALDPLNAAVTATVVTVLGTVADSTLGVNLSGDTNTGTKVVDANAKVINVTGSGTTTNNILLDAQDTPASGSKTFNFVNNGTGTLKVGTVTNSNGATVVTESGTGAVNLGNTGGWSVKPTSITSTGSGAITATVDGQNTAFTGGSGANVITVTSSGVLTKAINGGTSGNNTVVMTSTSTNYAGNLGAGLSNFQNVQLASGATGSYDVSTFTGTLTDNGATAAITFANAAAGQSLILAAATNSATVFAVTNVNNAADVLSATIDGKAITVAAGSTIAATAAATFAAAINNALPGVTAAAVGANITINGAATVGNVTSNNGATTFTPAVGGATGATEALDTPAAGITETLATLTGTGNTLPLTVGTATVTSGGVTAVLQEAGNQTISINSVKNVANGTNTVTIGDGTLTANANQATTINISGAGKTVVNYYEDGTATNALATINASSATGTVNVSGVAGRTGGMTITGGSAALTAFGSGLANGETAASYLTAVDTITTGSGGGTLTIGFAGAGGNAGSTAINLGASTAVADTILTATDATTGARATISGFTSSASSTTSDKLTFAVGARTVLTTNTTPAVTVGGGVDTYTISNGIIAFTGADSDTQLLADARAIVEAAGTNKVAAYVNAAGNTVVVASGSGTATAAFDNVLTLTGVTGITQLGGTTAATGNLVATNITGAAAAADATAGTFTQDDTGFATQLVSSANAGVHTFNNLAPSATVTLNNAGTYSLVTTQLGTAGSESMTLTETAATTLTSATFTGDNALTINATTGTQVITSLVDGGATNTLAKITVAGAQQITIAAITDTALTSMSISDSGVVILGGSATPLSQTGLTVTLTSAATANDTIYLSGANAKIDASAVSFAAGGAVLSATGANSTILGGTGAQVETITAGNNATVTMLQGVIATNTAGNASANVITVGTNSTVTLGTNGVGLASDNGSNIVVTGDIAGAASSGAYTFTTINNAKHGTTTVNFFAAGTEQTGTKIDVASATSLANALDIAAANLSNTGAANNTYDYFQMGGNTWVLAHHGAAETAMSSNDLLVKIVGLDAPALTVAGHNVLL